MSVSIEPLVHINVEAAALTPTAANVSPRHGVAFDGDLVGSPVPELIPSPSPAPAPSSPPEPEFTMRPFPDVPIDQLCRQFKMDMPNIEVTSIDVVAHGCYVLAGCSNGLIMLFDLSSSSRTGCVIGHIRAKGLHTNLLLTVKVTEDSRLCFAGVHKGSMEMLALDLSRLPGWPEDGSTLRKRVKYEELITTSSYSDPKLRGFGAVVRVQADKGTVISAGENGSKYILACGRGIKNVHIWTFTPDSPGGAQWSFVYDVASNGNTIESVGFRDGGRQAISKSAGMCVRMWNMSADCADSVSDGVGSSVSECDSPRKLQSAEDSCGDQTSAAAVGTGSEPSAKLPYEDIANSHDVRTFADCFGFGGTYEFALVRLDAPKWANRELFELPSRGMDDDNGNRRKRQMRQIQDVTSTQDGCHLLILLTDGGVLYFRAGTENASDSQEISEMDDGQSIELNRNGNAARATLTEFSKLSYNPIEDSAWSIKRVAASGTVVLLRASRKEDSGFSTLSVCPLSEEAPEEVADTRLKPGSKWNEWAWFCNTQAMIDAANDSEAESQAAVLRNKDLDMVKLAPSGKPPLNRRGVKKERSVRNDVLPTPLKTDSINDYQTPGVGGPSPVAKYSKHISPADALEKVVFERAHPGSAISRPKKKRVQLSTPAREIGAMEVEFSNSSESSSKRRRSEALGPAMASPLPHIGNITSNYQNTVTIQLPETVTEQLPRPAIPEYIPKQRSVLISDYVIPAPIDVNADRKKQFQLLCESWRARQVSAVEVKCVPSNFKVMPSCSIMSGLDILSFVATSIPPSPLSGSIETQSLNQNCAFIQQAVVICMQEQTTLWSQYITEIVRCVTRQFHESLSPSESQWVSQFLPRSFQSLNAISCRYGDALDKLLLRQKMDVTCVAASLGDVPSSYQLLSFDQSKATWVNNSIFPRVVSVSDAIIAAKEFETSAVMLAVSS